MPNLRDVIVQLLNTQSTNCVILICHAGSVTDINSAGVSTVHHHKTYSANYDTGQISDTFLGNSALIRLTVSSSLVSQSIWMYFNSSTVR